MDDTPLLDVRFGTVGESRSRNVIDDTGDWSSVDNEINGGCTAFETCVPVKRGDGSDTNLVKSNQTGKLYLSEKFARQVALGHNINWNKVYADLAVLGFTAIGGAGPQTVRSGISIFGGTLATWWQSLANPPK
jgi:hypothetical protein